MRPRKGSAPYSRGGTALHPRNYLVVMMAAGDAAGGLRSDKEPRGPACCVCASGFSFSGWAGYSACTVHVCAPDSLLRRPSRWPDAPRGARTRRRPPELAGQPSWRRVAGGGGPSAGGRARARRARHAPGTRPCARPAPPAQRSGAALAATVCSGGLRPPPPSGRGLCPLSCALQARRISSRRMPGPVSTAATTGRAGTERGRKMVQGSEPLPAERL